MWEKCVGCGEGLFAGDAFCGNCGRPVKPAVPAAREPGGLESGPLTAPTAGRAPVRIIPAHRGDSPGHAAAEQAAAEQFAADQAARAQLAPGQVVPGQVVPGQVAPGQVASGQVAADQALPATDRPAQGYAAAPNRPVRAPGEVPPGTPRG
ncbi:MAG TPA: hypothetical protein VF933_30935 [Streptosporangiaceae bacterium]